MDGVSQGYAQNRLYALKQVLNMIFKYSVSFNLLSENPLSKIRIPKYKVTVAELKAVVSSVEEKYLAIVELPTLINYGSFYE